MKVCGMCQLQKPLMDFRVERKGGREYIRTYCKPCDKKRQQIYTKTGRYSFEKKTYPNSILKKIDMPRVLYIEGGVYDKLVEKINLLA
jgi:hypothetical protein